ncbi:TonB-dependent receptor [Cesiribacter sp. SM1]|uniref:TonB-dependent receptor n=1 Tax=Cesiribacter sp. SM1 TaxID=2861196 RepID=UPI001CD58E8D|nr:TonB-dependent receptor [Cesiribacter sp. SM1]
MKYRYLLFFFLISTLQANAQGIKNIKIDETVNGKPLSEFLLQMEKEHGIDFIFEKAVVAPVTVSGVTNGTYFNTYLNLLLGQYKLKLVRANPGTYFILEQAEAAELADSKESVAVLALKPTDQQTIRGVLTDSDTKQPLIGAQVVIPGTAAGVLTDANGSFQLKVAPGIYKIEMRYVGYETTTLIVGFSPSGQTEQLKVNMLQDISELESVTITAEREDHNIQSMVPGIEKMGIEEIKKLPTFMGEVDPVKSLTTLPGVSTVGELSSGFNVRGGETGQNLIVQDGAMIYNPTHLFGFFSAFNPDIVSDVALYKGGGPARFGGRVSSVLDIKLRNGSLARHQVKGGIGLISSRLSVEGPILKNKASYIIGGRISYSNWLLKATDDIQLMNSSAKFHDITARTFYQINPNNSISLSGYRSYDDFRLASDSTISWQTTNASLRWEHTFSDALIAALTLSGSQYSSEISSDDKIEPFVYRNAVNNLWLRYDLTHRSEGRIEYNFGVEASNTRIEPGQLAPRAGNSNAVPIDINDQHVVEAAAYWQADVDLSEKWAISAGLRYSHFFRLGSDAIYTFDYNNIQGRYPAISDTVHYGSGDIIQDYGGLEPRLSVRYLLNESTSLKASYFRTLQYLHLISNTASATPQDYWIASGPYLEPEIANQGSIGLFKNLNSNRWELSLEGFYKEIENTVDYIDGADITLNEKLEAGLLSGRGVAYGLEVLVRKNAGKFSGWIAYTYSRSLRKFISGSQLMTINRGDYYPAPYDKPHDLSVVLNYQLAPRVMFSSNFSYSTGRPITIPVSKFNYDDYLAVLHFSQRNEYRIPDYHRLDLSLTLEGKQGKNSGFRGDWVFSVFNVYGRNNAYSIFFNQYGTARKLSVLGSAFPSISYNFRFL